MKFLKLLRVGTAALFATAWLIGFSSGRAQAQEVQWHRIFGIPEAFNVVGSGTGAVGGATPWTTTSGHAEVDLKTIGQGVFALERYMVNLPFRLERKFVGALGNSNAACTEQYE